MNEPQQPKSSPTDSIKSDAGKTAQSDSSHSGVSPAAESKPTKELSAEEQMALYEKELKENDWGHQPC